MQMSRNQEFNLMPGMIPGPIGFAAFAGVKFAGYTLAGTILRRTYPAETASAVKIAATRTVLGLALGIAHVAFWGWFFGRNVDAKVQGTAFIVGLVILRLMLWSAIIWLFCDRRWEHPLRLLGYAVAGTAFSFLLDVAGLALAFVAPGKIPFC
jgi:hypothetical protein